MSVIRVQNLSKRFFIQQESGGMGKYSALRDVVADSVKRWGKKKNGIENEEFWALQDVNFDIQPGERVGIIGRNGAGKSTLLKILSRITEPTTGSISIKGRVASLLEVGTGFHQELTGRENIYLNGAILGMKRAEVRKKFDEIVAFAEVEKFLDTPVKRYSSGMYVRLAFAVAAHLEPEILIVDEVLAVGDAQFQKKCLGKMEDVSRGEGRTVLFVSHNMQAINTLCSHGIFMNKGKALPKVSAQKAIGLYTQNFELRDGIVFPVLKQQVAIHDFKIIQNGLTLQEYEGDQPIDVLIEFEISEDLSNFRVGFFIRNAFGEIVNRSLLADWRTEFSNLKKGRYTIKGFVPSHLLVSGNYTFQVHTSRFGLVDYGTDEPTSTLITILPPHEYNQAYISETIFGTILIKQNWEIDKV